MQKPKRLSARLDSIRAYFMETYKKDHRIEKDIGFINDACDALKEKENNKLAAEIKKYEDKIFAIIEILGTLKESRKGDQEKYLEVLQKKLEEVKRISGK